MSFAMTKREQDPPGGEAPRPVQEMFTTGEVARLLDPGGSLSAKTIGRWIEIGHLAGVQFPGAKGDRRVYRAVLRRFCRENGYIPALNRLNAEEGLPELPVPGADPPGETPTNPPTRRRRRR